MRWLEILRPLLIPAGVAIAAFTPVEGQEATTPVDPFPSAHEILTRYVDALGGEDAIRGHSAATWKGTFELPGMGVLGELEIRAAAPDLLWVRVEAEGLGALTQGYDGEVAWIDNPMSGPMVLEGEMRWEMAVQADFYADLHYLQNYQSVEVAAEESIDGEDCYSLRLLTPAGKEILHFFSLASGLLVATRGHQATPMGDVSVTTSIGDYEEFSGRLYPTVLRQDVMGAEQVMTLLEADFAPIDPSSFDLPPSIRSLLDVEDGQQPSAGEEGKQPPAVDAGEPPAVQPGTAGANG